MKSRSPSGHRYRARALLIGWLASGPLWAGAAAPPAPADDPEIPYIREIQQTSLAIRSRDADAATYLRRAEAYHELEKHGKAAADYTEAIARGAGGGDVYLARAKCFNVMGRNPEALQDALRAQELLPPGPVVFHRLADIHVDMGRHELAFTAFAKGLELSPTNAALLTCRARLHRRTGDLDAAEQGFNAAIARDPEYIYAYHCRGRLFAARGQHHKAVRDFTAVVRAPPTCYLRGLQMGDYLARARSLRALGKEHRPDHFRALREYARMAAIDRCIAAAEAGAFNPAQERLEGN